MITLNSVIRYRLPVKKGILGRKWDIILYANRSTCFISTPFNVDKNSNVMTVFKTDNLCSCHRYASKFADDYDDAKFLLWSPSAHLLSEDVGGNCFVFKTCDEKRRISISYPGITYQLKRINTVKKGVYFQYY